MATTPDQHGAGEVASFAISEVRKQMLIGNLQLEVTDRARKLRAQYALQAQGLRTRLEMRVNRIPQSSRNINMQELAEKYSQPLKSTSFTSPHKSIPRTHGIKRSSDAIGSDDKENAQPAGLDNPKKRVKTTATVTAVPVKPSAAAARKPPSATVLSPKSQNPRSYYGSPLKSTSPIKESTLPKSTSRMNLVPAKPPARPVSRAAKKPVAQPALKSKASQKSLVSNQDERPSTSSDSSDGATIFRSTAASTTGKKPAAAAAPAKSRAAGLKSALSSLTGSRRVATKKAATTAATDSSSASTTTVGGRTLRKRG